MNIQEQKSKADLLINKEVSIPFISNNTVQNFKLILKKNIIVNDMCLSYTEPNTCFNTILLFTTGLYEKIIEEDSMGDKKE